MQSQSDFTPKKVSDRYNQLLIEFNEAFNKCTENQTDDDYRLLIKNSGKYFEYVDLSLEFLNYLLDITFLIYDDSQRVLNKKFKNINLSENVKEQILSFKRKVTPGVEKLRDKLETIDSELFNNVIPSFRSKCIQLNYLEIPRSELVYKLFQIIQKENESTYVKLKGWQECEGISWPNNLVPNIMSDRNLQQLFNYSTSNGLLSSTGELNSFEKIKKHSYGFDREK
ncbi:MAG: hypothetical protein GY775_06340, partial [Candidatus Scalindua sp.]|nr:hypothetical protein [Candidatus Scalindua sp.]